MGKKRFAASTILGIWSDLLTGVLLFAAYLFVSSDSGKEVATVVLTWYFDLYSSLSQFDYGYRPVIYVLIMGALSVILSWAISKFWQFQSGRTLPMRVFDDWRIVSILLFVAMTIGHYDFVAPRMGIDDRGQAPALLVSFFAFLSFQIGLLFVSWWRDYDISKTFFFKNSKETSNSAERAIPWLQVHAFFFLSVTLFAVASIILVNAFESFFDNPIVAHASVLAAFPISIGFTLWLYFMSRKLFPSYYVANFLKSVARRQDFQTWCDARWADFQSRSVHEKMSEVENFYRWKFERAQYASNSDLVWKLRGSQEDIR